MSDHDVIVRALGLEFEDETTRYITIQRSMLNEALEWVKGALIVGNVTDEAGQNAARILAAIDYGFQAGAEIHIKQGFENEELDYLMDLAEEQFEEPVKPLIKYKAPWPEGHYGH